MHEPRKLAVGTGVWTSSLGAFKKPFHSPDLRHCRHNTTVFCHAYLAVDTVDKCYAICQRCLRSRKRNDTLFAEIFDKNTCFQMCYEAS
jgi:hypothetical protein